MLPRRCTVARYSRRPLALGSDEELQQASQFVVSKIPTTGAEPISSRAMQESMQESMQRVESAIQDEAIKNALVSAGFSLALNAIPGIGNGLSALMGVVQGYMGSKYKKKIENKVKSSQKELKEYINRRMEEAATAVTNAYRQARAEGFRLAISFQEVKRHEGGDQVMLNPYMNGFSGLGLDLTGHSTWTTARDKLNEEVKRLKKQIDDYVDPMLTKIKSPGFRGKLAQDIAISVRKRPDFAAKLRTANIPPPPPKYMTHKTTGSTPLPTTGGYDRIPTAGPDGGQFDTPSEVNWLPVAGVAAAGLAAVLFLR